MSRAVILCRGGRESNMRGILQPPQGDRWHLKEFHEGDSEQIKRKGRVR